MIKNIKELLKLTWPLLAAMVAGRLFGIIDVAMVGSLGTEGIAGLSLGLTYYNLFYYIVVFAFLQSNLIHFAKYSTPDKGVLLRNYIIHEVILGALLALLAVILLGPTLWGLQFLTDSGETLYHSRRYLFIRSMGVMPMFLMAMYSKLLIAIERNQFLPVFTIIGLSFNVLFNWIFIYGNLGMPALGVLGAGLASVLAMSIHSAMLMWYFYRITGHFEQRTGRFVFSPAILRERFTLSFTIMQSRLFEQGSWTAFVSIISTISPLALSIHEISMRVKDFILMISGPVRDVTMSQVSKKIESQQESDAKQSCITGAVFLTVTMGTLGMVMVFLPEPFIRLFSDNPEVIEKGKLLFLIMGIYQIADAVFISFQGGLLGMEDVKFVRNINILSGWVLMLPLVLLMTNVLTWGVYGAWAGFATTIFIRAFIFAARFLGKEWIPNSPRAAGV